MIYLLLQRYKNNSFLLVDVQETFFESEQTISNICFKYVFFIVLDIKLIVRDCISLG